MSSIPLRSFVKGVCWETISFVLTLFAIYLIYGNFLSSLIFTSILTIIKIFLFFAHERLWKKIRWGKYHIMGGRKVFEKAGKKGKKKEVED
jgi:adenylylsulfate kinase